MSASRGSIEMCSYWHSCHMDHHLKRLESFWSWWIASESLASSLKSIHAISLIIGSLEDFFCPWLLSSWTSPLPRQWWQCLNLQQPTVPQIDHLLLHRKGTCCVRSVGCQGYFTWQICRLTFVWMRVKFIRENWYIFLMCIFRQGQFLIDKMNYVSGCGYLKKMFVLKERKIP